MEKEFLKTLIIDHGSTYKIANEIGKNSNTIIYWIKKHDLTSFYKDNTKYAIVGKPTKYDKEMLSNIVKKSNTYTDILNSLGLVPRGRNFDTIKKYIILYELDITHFDARKKQKEALINYNRKNKKNIEEYLVKGSNIKSNALKLKLYKVGILTPICCLCGQDDNWKGVKISLILDHIDGDHTNNDINNLRIVCPNCNAGLDTFCGKNKREIEKEDIKKSRLGSRKINRPDKEILIYQVKEFGYRGTGKIYGVSDNAIRKWIK